MKSYESATATLRAILAHPSLQREKIDETMDAMASVNAEAKDIDEAIRMGVEIAQSDAGIDDSELEDELAALVKEVEQEKSGAEATTAHKEKLSVPALDTPRDTPTAEQKGLGRVPEAA
jgi:charged multivesicular body protein 7